MVPAQTSDDPVTAPRRRRWWPRLTIRRLMWIVLAAALVTAAWVAVENRRQRSVRAWVNLHAQSNTTFQVEGKVPLPVAVGSRSASSRMTPPSRWYADDQEWTIFINSPRDQPSVRVAGACRDGRTDPDPIVIEDCGAATSAPIIAALEAAYQARGWAYRVVPQPVDRLLPAAK